MEMKIARLEILLLGYQYQRHWCQGGFLVQTLPKTIIQLWKFLDKGVLDSYKQPGVGKFFKGPQLTSPFFCGRSILNLVI